MSKQHTQGQLVAYGLVIRGCPDTSDESQIAAAFTPEDARRLVACWNACEGLSTDDIEGLINAGGWPGTFLCIDELHASVRKTMGQRAAALDLLREVLLYADGAPRTPIDQRDTLQERIRALVRANP